MGTRFELVIAAGSNASRSPRDLRAAGEAAIEEIEEWHRRLTRFAPDSLVSHINRTAAKEAVRLDEDTWGLVLDALQVWRDSRGAFDITVAPLMPQRGFADSAVPASGASVGSGGLVLDPAARTIRFGAGRVSVDLGGIAKGHAIDCAAAVLRRHGVGHAFLHGGTSSGCAIGRAPDGRPWRVALDPAGTNVLDLADEAYALSDPGSQTTPAGAAHIVDPRSCMGVADRLNNPAGRSVVSGPSARVADAWSTALTVLGVVPPAFPQTYTARWISP
jgi:thiamine biosynthesis lipoprotein